VTLTFEVWALNIERNTSSYNIMVDIHGK